MGECNVIVMYNLWYLNITDNEKVKVISEFGFHVSWQREKVK